MTSPAFLQVETTDSTQDDLHRLAAEGAPAGTAILARRQDAGRGSRGRAWESDEGGMWLSVLWRGDPTGAQLLSLRAGLEVAAHLEALGLVPRLKWPNDVLVEDRKVGGILCEGRWQGQQDGWVVIGVGLNVRNVPPAAARFPAAALVHWLPAIEAGPLARRLAPRLAALPGDARLSAEEMARWHARDWRWGRHVRGPVEGRVDGITPTGRLVVNAGNARRELVAGDGLEL